MRSFVMPLAGALLVAAPVFAQTPPPPAEPPPPGPEPVTPASTEKPKAPEKKPVTNKWDVQLYGFAELDTMFDTTESLNEISGNGIIAKGGSYAGEHPRFQMTPRNSRIGLRIAAPEFEGIKASANLEMDFFGNQPGNPPSFSEGSFYNNGGFRIRHAFLKVETDVVDVTFGQTWELFGWQPYFQPNTVELQGVPGELYSRTQQIRLSKKLKSEAVDVEIAVAASRAPQRDAGIPDGQAGVRVLVNGVKGLHTLGGTGTAIDALAVGVSGLVRSFALPQLAATPDPTKTVTTTGYAVNAGVFLPIIPATKEHHENALSLSGELAYGAGFADLYTGLTGGASLPTSVPGTMPAVAYTANVDPGLVTFDPNGNLTAIKWLSVLGGVQYYLPPSGSVWIALNGSFMKSDNIVDVTAAAAQPNVMKQSLFLDGNLFWDVTPAVRLGAAYSYFRQTRGDDKTAENHRVLFSAWYIF